MWRAIEERNCYCIARQCSFISIIIVLDLLMLEYQQFEKEDKI